MQSTKRRMSSSSYDYSLCDSTPVDPQTACRNPHCGHPAKDHGSRVGCEAMVSEKHMCTCDGMQTHPAVWD